MGIVNVTPDSFSDGAIFADANEAVEHGLRLVEEGADLLDVGGESTRPGAAPVTIDEEIARVVPVIEGLVKQVDVPLSVDTRKADVAVAALGGGAAIVNDVSAGADPDMFEVVHDRGGGMVLMHMKGDPTTMQDDPTYDDVVAEVRAFLADRVESAVVAGVARDHLCLDPGIGFGKTVEHNLALLHGIASFGELGLPVLVGASRKRFVGTLTGVDDPGDRVEGSVAAAAWCAAQGVDIVRVHDVRPTVRALRIVDAIVRGSA